MGVTAVTRVTCDFITSVTRLFSFIFYLLSVLCYLSSVICTLYSVLYSVVFMFHLVEMF